MMSSANRLSSITQALRTCGGWRLALVIALLAALPAGAAPGAEVLVGRLQSWLDQTRDLEGRFVQTLSSGALGRGLEESGRFYLLRPGRMRWDYIEPERKVALLDGQSTRLYIEEDAQLWDGRLEQGGLLSALLAGSEPVADGFEASVVAAPLEGEQLWRLQLVPLVNEDAFREVVLTLRAPDYAIVEAEVLDGTGNRMRYRFSEMRRNLGLSEEVFHFEAPPGTEVLRP